MKLIYLVIALTVCTSISSLGQDLHLSMSDESSVLLNPALTGVYEGSYRFHLQHRSQWGAFLTKPYRVENFSAERNMNPYGAGITILNNRAGEGGFNRFSLYASGSYEVTIDPNKYHHLLCGVHLGLVQNSVNFSTLTFDSQYSTSGGFDPTINSNESFSKTSATAADVNFGIFYFAQKKMNYFNHIVYRTSTYNPYGGITIYHLTAPKMVFGEFKDRLNRRWLLYGGCRYKVNSNIAVDPNILWENQARVNDFSFGSNVFYYYEPYKVFGVLGLNYRVKDAVILKFGAIYKQYAVKFSYDFNTSKVRTFSHGRGGFEISITYTMYNETASSML